MEEAVEDAGDHTAIVGELELNEADLQHMLQALPGLRRVWVMPTLMVVFALLYLALKPGGLGSEAMLSVGLPVSFAAVLSYFMLRGKQRAWVKQALLNIGGHTTFRFDDYGFSSEASKRQHRIAWAALVRTQETPAAFLVYTTPQTVLIVPKRAFAAADVATLSRRLLERVPPPPALSLAGRFAARRALLLWVVLIVAFASIGSCSTTNPRRGTALTAGTKNAARTAIPSMNDKASDVDSSR